MYGISGVKETEDFRRPSNLTRLRRPQFQDSYAVILKPIRGIKTSDAARLQNGMHNSTKNRSLDPALLTGSQQVIGIQFQVLKLLSPITNGIRGVSHEVKDAPSTC